MKPIVLFFSATLVMSDFSYAGPFSFSYGGRLTDSEDRSVEGPVDLEIRFWSAAVNGTDKLGRALIFKGVKLEDGIFQLDASETLFSPADTHQVFGVSGDTWVEIKDAKNNVTYPRQVYNAVPYALKTPVDGKTITYNSTGRMTLSGGTPTPGFVFTAGANGAPVWAAPQSGSTGTVTSVIAGTGLVIGGGAASISSSGTLSVDVGTSANKILQIGSDGKLPAVDGSKVTNLNASSVNTGTLSVANGGTGSTTISGALSALGAVAISGDTMTGTLSLPSDGFNVGTDQLALANGNVGIGTTSPTSKLEVAGQVKITGGAPGIGKVLTSDSVGLASWQAPSGGSLAYGAHASAVANSLYASTSGLIGVGTTAPQTKLHIESGALRIFNGTTSPANLSEIQIVNHSSSGSPGISFAQDNTPGSLRFKTKIAANGGGSYGISDLHFVLNNVTDNASAVVGTDTKMILKSNGNVGIGTTNPTQKLEVYGNVRILSTADCTLGQGTAGTNCTSDAQLKDHVRPISNALEKIGRVRGVSFVWNEKSKAQGQSAIGVIAQEVEAMFPSAVIENPVTGYKMVDYAVLVAPLIEGIKELRQQKDQEISALQQENKAMKIVLCELKPEAAFCGENQ